MNEQQEKEFIEQAFQTLKERGWFSDQEFERSTITEGEIVAFEQEHQVELPSLYKTFLTSFCLPQIVDNEICSVIEYAGDFGPLWIMIDSPRTMKQVLKRMENLREVVALGQLPKDRFRKLIPIGDWGAGWGPLCIDLSVPEDKIDENNEFTWSLVWFDHEDFDMDERSLGKDGLLHGHEVLPNFKKLMELYFYGALEDRFEQEEGIKPPISGIMNGKAGK